jgi:hypothetical protein
MLRAYAEGDWWLVWAWYYTVVLVRQLLRASDT